MELFSILYAMNSISDNTLSLERSRETNGSVKEKRTIDEIQAKMNILRAELEKARQKAGTNEKLHAEIDRLEESLYAKEREIKRLKTDIAIVDDKIEEAIQELEIEKEAIAKKNLAIEQANDSILRTNKNKLDTDQRAWIEAGDAVIMAARTIPRPHNLHFQVNKVEPLSGQNKNY